MKEVQRIVCGSLVRNWLVVTRKFCRVLCKCVSCCSVLLSDVRRQHRLGKVRTPRYNYVTVARGIYLKMYYALELPI